MQMTQGRPTTRVQARVLVVDDEPVLLELFREILTGRIGCDLFFAASLAEARGILADQSIDLLVIDINLPDGSGLSLLDELRRTQPAAEALVISGKPSVEGAIDALRGGAIDFLPKPFDANELAARVAQALESQALRAHQQKRARKLRDAVRRLNAARKIVSKKVDLLCNDLIGAYGELSHQLDTVRVQEGFRQFIDSAGGLEQLLCHTMDWLLRQMGHCNIGIWLTTSEQELQLGAFMKYTIAAEPDLTSAVENNLLRMTLRRGFVRLRGPELESSLTPAEMRFLSGQDIVSINCTYLGEALGAIALFRDQKTPFSEDDVAALKVVGPLFALALARAVKENPAPGEPAEPAESAGPPDDEPKSKRRKKDPADWWKTGEEPPF